MPAEKTDRPNLTQEVMLRMATPYADQWEEGHPAAGPASRFSWHFATSYPIARIQDRTDAEWRDWMLAEVRMWAEDGDPDYWNDEIRNPTRDPVIVVEIDGRAHTWDGNHRIGGSVLSNRETVPAIVGVPKADEPPAP